MISGTFPARIQAVTQTSQNQSTKPQRNDGLKSRISKELPVVAEKVVHVAVLVFATPEQKQVWVDALRHFNSRG